MAYYVTNPTNNETVRFDVPNKLELYCALIGKSLPPFSVKISNSKSGKARYGYFVFKNKYYYEEHAQRRYIWKSVLKMGETR